ncbi:hypothetical protein chiPu_0023588, partial [Chiloscyllium punctatum]|nr:hypothetical protein [Chiloscyllium punctatum]
RGKTVDVRGGGEGVLRSVAEGGCVKWFPSPPTPSPINPPPPSSLRPNLDFQHFSVRAADRVLRTDLLRRGGWLRFGREGRRCERGSVALLARDVGGGAEGRLVFEEGGGATRAPSLCVSGTCVGSGGGSQGDVRQLCLAVGDWCRRTCNEGADETRPAIGRRVPAMRQLRGRADGGGVAGNTATGAWSRWKLLIDTERQTLEQAGSQITPCYFMLSVPLNTYRNEEQNLVL